MDNPKYDTSLLTIKGGNVEAADKNITLPSSNENHLIGIAVQNNEDVLISITENGNTRLPFINATWLDGKQGSFDDRALELDFSDQRDLTLKAKALKAPANDIVVEFTFKRYE